MSLLDVFFKPTIISCPIVPRQRISIMKGMRSKVPDSSSLSAVVRRRNTFEAHLTRWVIAIRQGRSTHWLVI